MFYYAFIDEMNTVTGVYSLPSTITAPGYIAITEQQYNDSQAGNENSLIGKVYDATTGTFHDPISWVCSTADIEYKDTETSLESKLDSIDTAIANIPTVDTHTHDNKTVLDGITAAQVAQWNAGTGGSGTITAEQALDLIKSVDGPNSGLDADTLDGMEATAFATASHTHDGYAPTDHTHTGFATTEHTHTGYAEADHTHTGYATTEQLNGKADTTHTHTEYATTEQLSSKADTTHTHEDYVNITTYANGMSGKADTDHTHTEYATTSALSGKADTNHSHSGYATSGHTHSGYASSSHNHSSLTGDVNITGAIKANGQQAAYNSGSAMTLSTGNLPTIIAGTQVTLNGEKVYSPNIYPRNGGTFTLGAYSNRWTNIYSTNTVNVSSDKRLKENIETFNQDEAVKLINDIDVVSFNFIGNTEPQIGVIAQDIVEISPEIAQRIVTQGEDGYYGVKTSDLVFPLIQAVQALTKRVEELEKKSN